MTNPLRPPTPSVAVVLPLHRLDENGCPVFVRRRGRQRRIERVPTISEAHYHATVAEAAERSIEQDEVVVATSAGDPEKVIAQTMVGVARESAALHWDRIKSQNEGRADAEKISSRRVAALCRLADLVVVREEMRRASGQMSDEEVGRATELFIQDMEETVREVAPSEVAEKFLSSFKTKVATSGLPCGTAT